MNLKNIVLMIKKPLTELFIIIYLRYGDILQLMIKKIKFKQFLEFYKIGI